VEEARWDVLRQPSCSPDLAPSDFHLFGPVKKTLGRKIFRADDEVKTFCAAMAGRATAFFFNEAARAMATVYRGTGKICRKIRC